MSRRPQDSWGRKAKKEGFTARSVYKLEEIDRRVKLLRAGMKVFDLGAFPGSWTTYAAQKVGPQGKVIGVDIQEFRGALPPWAEIRHDDAFVVAEKEFDAGSFDVVLSDMAPNTSGHRFTDQSRSFDLFMRATDIAEYLVRPGGHFVGKIFLGGDFELARDRIRSLFEETKIIKPPATRSESYETFIVGLRRRGVSSIKREATTPDPIE